MNKRELLFGLLDSDSALPYVPAAFFLHFPPEFHKGPGAIAKHLEFFRYTGMDLLKIQYEQRFPYLPDIQHPEDWEKMPRYGIDFFEEQLNVVEGLVQATKHEAVVVVTLYSPFMCAGHTVGADVLIDHLKRDPDQVKRGLEVITDSLLLFARECVKRGVDGFYHSTQGGESGRLNGELFANYVRPFDLAIMEEVNEKCPFNILHVCDYVSGYDDFSRFLDYPGDIVSCPFHVGDRAMTAQELAGLFGRPIMGGLERKGVIARGTPQEIQEAAQAVLRDAPRQFALGADCTVPDDTPWDNLRIAIEEAHAFSR